MIHPSAVVEEGARLGTGVRIGAFAYVGPRVVLEDGVELRPHAVVTGDTRLGEGSVVFSHAAVGEIPQDLKFKGERTSLVIGARNRIREGATLNVGTAGGGGVTRVGDDNLFMTGAHVAHDAVVGSRVVVANQSAIAGHCEIGDDVVIRGLSGIHQFVRVGRGAIIGAMSKVTHDVMPYGLVQGPRGELEGLNLVGLKRRGVERSEITALRAAYATLMQGEGTFLDRAERLSHESDSPHVKEICDFLLSETGRSFLTPR